jgi:hypothetical protein
MLAARRPSCVRSSVIAPPAVEASTRRASGTAWPSAPWPSAAAPGTQRVGQGRLRRAVDVEVEELDFEVDELPVWQVPTSFAPRGGAT